MPDNHAQAYGKIIAKAWSDPAFAKKLETDAATALAEVGIEVPEGARVTSYFAAENEVVVLVPPKPSAELADEALEAMAGGGCKGTSGTVGTFGCPVGTVGSTGTYGCH